MSERKETILMLMHGFGLAIAMIFSAVAMVLYIGDVISGFTFAEGIAVAVLGIRGAIRAYDMATDNYI